MGKGQPHLGIRLEYPSFWDKTCPLCAFCNCFSIRTLRTQRPHWGFLHMASCLKMDYIPVNGKLNGKSMKMHLNNFEYMLMICLFGFWGTYFQTNIKKLTIRTIQKTPSDLGVRRKSPAEMCFLFGFIRCILWPNMKKKPSWYAGWWFWGLPVWLMMMVNIWLMMVKNNLVGGWARYTSEKPWSEWVTVGMMKFHS